MSGSNCCSMKNSRAAACSAARFAARFQRNIVTVLGADFAASIFVVLLSVLRLLGRIIHPNTASATM